MEIATERFVLRPLTENDATERYLSWLQDSDALKFISSAAHTQRLSDLQQYVRERAAREDVLFLGIFDQQTRQHVGNIKYEPVDSVRGYAIMGILIGDPVYRGRGVTSEVLTATAKWLKVHRKIQSIVLGVSKDNYAAIKAYERVGFVVAETPYLTVPIDRVYSMVWML